MGFLLGVTGFAGYGASYTRALHIPYGMLWPSSVAFGALWLVALIVAIILYRRRGLWLLVPGPAALIWPTLGCMFLHAIATCALSNPANAAMCYP